jgi:hypothetical protein
MERQGLRECQISSLLTRDCPLALTVLEVTGRSSFLTNSDSQAESAFATYFIHSAQCAPWLP